MSGRGPESPKGAGQMEYLDKVSSPAKNSRAAPDHLQGAGRAGGGV